MRRTFGNTVVEVLGDPHLGRVFKNGVPLHRRGEREESQWQDLQASLDDVAGADIHVCMGDLFDSFVVPPEIVLQAANLYWNAAEEHPDVTYFVLRGNHDGSRDSDRASSFDLFAALMADQPNIRVIRQFPTVWNDLLFVPWHPFDTAEQMVRWALDLYGDMTPFSAVFGHWEIDSFGGADENLLPYDLLKEHTDTVVTGHIHEAQEFKRKGLDIIVTGSMQPYAHGEGDLYVTKTLEEVLAADPEDFKDVCLRVILEPGEELPDIDCLQLTAKRVAGPVEEVEEVEIEKFDFRRVFHSTFERIGVDGETTAEAWDIYSDLRSEDYAEAS